MSGTGDARQAWLKRVLGVVLPEAGGASANGAGDWQAARQAWQAASDTVDGQITALQAALRQSGDETLREIAEYGLNGVTGNYKVPLMAAMAEQAGPKALEVIRAFRSHIEADERIEVCDDNPFGVAVTIRATLGTALAQMEAALQRRAAA